MGIDGVGAGVVDDACDAGGPGVSGVGEVAGCVEADLGGVG